jgi:hypothetical protein
MSSRQLGGTGGYQPVDRNAMAIASVICAVVGVFVLEIILGPLAVVFGVLGLQRANAGAPNRRLAITGIVLGVIDTAFFVALIALTASGGGAWHI